MKVLEDVDTLSGLMTWTVVPNFRALGPRLGPRVNEVKAALAAADGSDAAAPLDADGLRRGRRRAAHQPTTSRCGPSATSDFALAEDDGWAVALDLELDDDLRAEGGARELVRALNDLRKEVGFAIADRIRRGGSPADPGWPRRLRAHGDWVAGEVLAVALDVVDLAARSRRPAGRRSPAGDRRRGSRRDHRSGLRPSAPVGARFSACGTATSAGCDSAS